MKHRIALVMTVAASMACFASAAPADAQSRPREIVVVMDNMNFGRLPSDAKVGDVHHASASPVAVQTQRRRQAMML